MTRGNAVLWLQDVSLLSRSAVRVRHISVALHLHARHPFTAAGEDAILSTAGLLSSDPAPDPKLIAQQAEIKELKAQLPKAGEDGKVHLSTTSGPRTSIGCLFNSQRRINPCFRTLEPGFRSVKVPAPDCNDLYEGEIIFPFQTHGCGSFWLLYITRHSKSMRSHGDLPAPWTLSLAADRCRRQRREHASRSWRRSARS